MRSRLWCFSLHFGELDDDLDIVILPLEGSCKVLRARSLLVISRYNQERSALASASPALYQCRLLALTLPTTTLFFRTAFAAISPVTAPVLRSPLPIPVRQMIPPVATSCMESDMIDP